MQVKKRNGDVVLFDQVKIKRAMLMAFDACDERTNVMPLVESVTRRVRGLDVKILGIEAVQDIVEDVLIDSGHTVVAKSYIRYRGYRHQVRLLVPNPLLLQDYTHVAKYAKYSTIMRRREIYPETVDRVVRMHVKRFPQLTAEIVDAFKLVHAKRVMPSMRSMQFGGAAIEACHARIYNCGGTYIDRVDVFKGMFFLLLAGCGPGYSVQWHHVDKLPKVKRIGRTVRHHRVADSIEGWADALGALMDGFFITGEHVEFSYDLIRDEGSPLVTSGGKAPGHLDLKIMFETIRGLLLKCADRRLRPIECYDIVCHIAVTVLAGGIRRSSTICLFSESDTEMLYAKSPGNFGGDINPQRSMSNNSMVVKTEENYRRVLRVAAEGFGDPGFFFGGPDEVCNPCGEIRMVPNLNGVSGFSFCNLTEVNAKDCSKHEFLDACQAASFIGTLQATYTDFSYLGSVTERIVRRDALIGVSVTGIFDNLQCIDWMAEGRAFVKSTNLVAADMFDIEPAIRCTTVKPSGTASLVLGCASGIHPDHAPRYFRRVTGMRSEPAVQHMLKVNPSMVEPMGDQYSLVFPCIGSASSVSGVEHLRIVLRVYEEWCDHSISCTITVADDEMSEILDIVWENKSLMGGLSFVGAGFDHPFAPRKAVVTDLDKEKWNNLINACVPVDWTAFFEDGADIVSRSSIVSCEGANCGI